MDALTARHVDSLSGSYDCVDRIVLNAYSLGHNAGGFRVWWRSWHADGDDSLDNTHLMRLAGRFSRRGRGWARANGGPVVDCVAGERKHRIAEDYLRDHTVGVGVFLILVARAPATVWKVTRSATSGKICNLEKTRQFVNHYSFHIMDPTWGHLTIKMSGHPPFGAQVILNGHEFVACTAHAAEIGFAKEGNCFTGIGDPKRLAQVADTLSRPGTAGRLGQVIDAWIHTACLCFGLDLADQQASGFRYAYSVYQVEYSRNLIFESGRTMERLFDSIVDRTRSRLDLPTLRTLFGVGARPRRAGLDLSPASGGDGRETTLESDHLQSSLRPVDLEGLHQGRTRPAVRSDRAQHPHPAHWPDAGQVRRHRRPAHRHGRPGHHPPRLRRRQLPARRRPRPAARTQPDRRRPGRRPRHQQAAHPRRDGRGDRTSRRPRRVYRRRPRHPSPQPHRHRLHHPPGRLRPAQTPRQTPRHQTRPRTPLPRSR